MPASSQTALAAAPAAEDGRFRVPRILDDEPPMGSSLTEPEEVGTDDLTGETPA